MRIAIDIDSTLHHYWDAFAASARRRFGVDLPYERQHTWDVTRLRPEQLRACMDDTHSDAAIAAARPYPDAVATVNGWHADGHEIHVMSHRAARCEPATRRWLDEIGLRHDGLHCCDDKVARSVELGLDVLIDDSPVDLARALSAGLQAATIRHPWNRDLCEEEDEIVCAPDWAGLARALGPILARPSIA